MILNNSAKFSFMLKSFSFYHMRIKGVTYWYDVIFVIYVFNFANITVTCHGQV